MSGMGLHPSAYNSSQVSAGQTFHPVQVSFPYTAPEHILLPFDGGNVTTHCLFKIFLIFKTANYTKQYYSLTFKEAPFVFLYLLFK